MGKLFIDYDGPGQLGKKKKLFEGNIEEIETSINEAISLLEGNEKVAPELNDIISELTEERNYAKEELGKLNTFYSEYCAFTEKVNSTERACIKSFFENDGYPCLRPMNNQSDADWRKDFQKKFIKESILYCAPGSGAMGIQANKDSKGMSKDKKDKKDENNKKTSSINTSSSVKLEPDEMISSKSTVGSKETIKISKKDANGGIISERIIVINKDTGEILQK